MSIAQQKSALFEPYRSIGLITDALPFAHAKIGTENFIMTITGKSYQVRLSNPLLLVVALLFF